MTLDMDARIAAAMQRQAEREAQKQAEEEAAKQAAWREACQKSEAYYAPLWAGDLTPDLIPVLRISWVDSGRNNSVPLRFYADLDGTRVAVQWQASASWQRNEANEPYGHWRLSYLNGGTIGNAERGQLADTLLAMLGRIRQERAEEEAREAEQQRRRDEERRANEARWAEQQRRRDEAAARELAEKRARWQALVAEDATARPLLDAAVEALRFRWPEGVHLTLYRAAWCEGYTYDEDEGTAPTYNQAWGLSDRPDGDGYYYFQGEDKHIKPPRETLVWERYEADSLGSLPAALCHTYTVWVPGFTTERMCRPDGNQHRPTEFIVQREGSGLERSAGTHPVRWVCEALGISDLPPVPAETPTATKDEDDHPF